MVKPTSGLGFHDRVLTSPSWERADPPVAETAATASPLSTVVIRPSSLDRTLAIVGTGAEPL